MNDIMKIKEWQLWNNLVTSQKINGDVYNKVKYEDGNFVLYYTTPPMIYTSGTVMVNG